MSEWVVVMTKPLGEEVAAKALVQRGWRVYLPRYRKILKGVRLDEDGKRHRARGYGEVVLRPLFPRYLFAEVEGGRWGGIVEATGVASLVGGRTGDYWEPRMADEELIEGIRDAERQGRFDEAREDGVRRDLKIGEEVRVAELDDRVAALVGLDDRDRAWVLLHILGRPVKVKVSAGSLTPVE